MTEETRTSHIAKLAADGSNWMLYRERMVVAFGTRGLTDHITSTTPTSKYITQSGLIRGLSGPERWDEEEFTFKDLIGMSVPDSVYLRIKGAAHAKGMWDQLKDMFEG
jgi:hypothetical protein